MCVGCVVRRIINFQCGAKEHGRGAPVRMSAAEDALADCHRMYKWLSIYACHLCDAGTASHLLCTACGSE
jgi:hypothetical protein